MRVSVYYVGTFERGLLVHASEHQTHRVRNVYRQKNIFIQQGSQRLDRLLTEQKRKVDHNEFGLRIAINPRSCRVWIDLQGARIKSHVGDPDSRVFANGFQREVSPAFVRHVEKRIAPAEQSECDSMLAR
jgi:hypothetical protein